MNADVQNYELRQQRRNRSFVIRNLPFVIHYSSFKFHPSDA